MTERERDSAAVYTDCDEVIDLVRQCRWQIEERKRFLGAYSSCPGGHDVRICDTALDGLEEVVGEMEAERDDVTERTLTGERSAA